MNKFIWRKKILTFFILGCWTKYINNYNGDILYGMWVCMFAFWTILIIVGMVGVLVDSKNIKSASKQLTEKEMDVWGKLNICALASYIICGEFAASILFLLSTCFFYILTLKARK